MRRAGGILLIIALAGCASPEPRLASSPPPPGYTQQLAAAPADAQPDTADLPAWLNRGHSYLAAEKFDEAAKCYEHVLTLEAEQPIALYNLGVIEFDRENYRFAVDLLQRAVEGRRLRADLQAKAELYLRQAREKA
jgi:tetratricopeptide (TPR) repeat protein